MISRFNNYKYRIPFVHKDSKIDKKEKDQKDQKDEKKSIIKTSITTTMIDKVNTKHIEKDIRNLQGIKLMEHECFDSHDEESIKTDAFSYVSEFESCEQYALSIE